MICKKKRRQATLTARDDQIVGEAIEECMDEINAFMETLEHYPPKVVTIAIGVHLQSLLSAMVECDLCTFTDAMAFMRQLQEELSNG